jgi:hypothetical protein
MHDSGQIDWLRTGQDPTHFFGWFLAEIANMMNEGFFHM